MRARRTTWRGRFITDDGLHRRRRRLLGVGLIGTALLGTLCLWSWLVREPLDPPRTLLVQLAGPAAADGEVSLPTPSPRIPDLSSTFSRLASALGQPADFPSRVELDSGEELAAWADTLSRQTGLAQSTLLVCLEAQFAGRKQDLNLTWRGAAGASRGPVTSFPDLLDQLTRGNPAQLVLICDDRPDWHNWQSSIRGGDLEQRIEEALEKWTASYRGSTTVWLLRPQSLGDLPISTGPREATLFPSAVALGLTGLADLNQDRQITLGELHQFVSRRVAQVTSSSTAGQARQIPRLMQSSRVRRSEPADLQQADLVRLLPVPRWGWEALVPPPTKGATSSATAPPSTEKPPTPVARDLVDRAIQQWQRGENGDRLDAAPAVVAPHLWKVFEDQVRQASRNWNAAARLSPTEQAKLSEFLEAIDSRPDQPERSADTSVALRWTQRFSAQRRFVARGPSLALLNLESRDAAEGPLLTLERLLSEETVDAFDGWWSELSPAIRMTQELLEFEPIRAAGVEWPVLRRILAARVRESRLAVDSREFPHVIEAQLLAGQRARRHAEQLLRDRVRPLKETLVLADLEEGERQLAQAERILRIYNRALRSLHHVGRRLPEWMALWSGCLGPGNLRGPTVGDLEEQLDLVGQAIARVGHPDPDLGGSLETLLARMDAIQERWSELLPPHIAAQLQRDSEPPDHSDLANKVYGAALVASLLRTNPLPPQLTEQLDRWRKPVDDTLREQLWQDQDRGSLTAFVEETRLTDMTRLCLAFAKLEAAVLKSLDSSTESHSTVEAAVQHVLHVPDLQAKAEDLPARWSLLRKAHDNWTTSREEMRTQLSRKQEGSFSPQQLRHLVWFLPNPTEELLDPKWDQRLNRAESLVWNDWTLAQANRLKDGLHAGNTADQPWLRLSERFLALGDSSTTRMETAGLELSVRTSPSENALISGFERAVVEISNPLSSPVQTWLLIDHDPALVEVAQPGDQAVHTIPNLHQRALGWEIAERDRQEASWLSQVAPDQAWTLAPGESRLVTLEWHPLAPRPGESRLILRAVGHRPASPTLATRVQSLDVTLPGEIPFELELRSSPGQAQTSGNWTLAGYPHRPWAESAQLLNRGPARTFDLEVWSLSTPPPEPPPQQLLTGSVAREWLDRQMMGPLLGRVERWGVPANGASGPLRFLPPATSEATIGEARTADGQPPPVSIPGGLLFVIRDSETGETLLRHQQLEVLHPASFVRPQVRHDPEEQLLTIEVRWIHASTSPGPISLECEVAPVDGPEPPRVYRSELGLGDQPARFELPLRPSRQTRFVTLSVSGYPRGFVYVLRPEQGAGEVPEESAPFAIRVVQPPPETALSLPAASLPIRVQVDAPRGVLPSSAAFWEVGLDQDRNREFRDEATLRFTTDRSVSAWFQGFTPEGGLRLEMRVDDFEIPLPLAGQASGRPLLLARLSAGGREVWSRPVELLLDGVAPRVKEVTAGVGGRAAIGEELTVSVRADDGELSGVARVEATFDRAGTGVFPTEPAPVVLAPSEPGRWIGKLPTADQTEGPITLLVRAIDRVGNVGRLTRRVLELQSAETITRERAARRIEVRGKVLYFGTPVPEISLVLRQIVDPPANPGADPSPPRPAEFNAVSNDRGEFRFPKVPPGKYTLLAKGVFRNKIREISRAVDLDDKSDGQLEDVNLP